MKTRKPSRLATAGLAGVLAAGALGMEGCGIGAYSNDPRAGFVVNAVAQGAWDLYVAEQAEEIEARGRIDAAETLKGNYSNTSYGSNNLEFDITNTFIKHNIYQNGEIGMNLHVDFEVRGHKGDNVQLLTYFYQADGQRLMDKDMSGKFRSSEGQVAVSGRNLYPSADDESMSDVIFMPYSQLDLTRNGANQLIAEIKLWDIPSGNRLIGDPTGNRLSFWIDKE